MLVLSGFGDAIDQSDPCSVNPSDPVCTTFYGGQAAANRAAIASTALPGASQPTDPSGCPPGYINVWNECIPNSAPIQVGTATSPSSGAAAALPKLSWKWMLGLLAVAGLGALAVHHYAHRPAS